MWTISKTGERYVWAFLRGRRTPYGCKDAQKLLQKYGRIPWAVRRGRVLRVYPSADSSAVDRLIETNPQRPEELERGSPQRVSDQLSIGSAAFDPEQDASRFTDQQGGSRDV
jgi:hypothetical protein